MNGGQPERTGLAWQRTALASAACTGLLLHGAVTDGSALLVAAAPLAVVTTLALALVGVLRSRSLRRTTEALHPAVAAASGVLVSLTAAAALVAVLTGR